MNQDRPPPLSGLPDDSNNDDDDWQTLAEGAALSDTEEAIATYEVLLREAVPSNGMSEDSDNNDNDRKRKHIDPSDSTSNNKRQQLIPVPNGGWTEEIHRSFVEAVYEIGLKHASPSVILESMAESDPALTSERVKSHLQKYRNNKEKSKSDFMDDYDSWMQKALTVGAASSGASSSLATPPAITEMMGINKLLGGDLAAFLTYAVMVEEEEVSAAELHPHLLSPDALHNGSNEYSKYFTGAKIPFPVLTEEERKSPLGVSISHVFSLFYSMTQHLMKERQARERQRGTEVAAGESSGSGAVKDVANRPPEPWDTMRPGFASMMSQPNHPPVASAMPAQARVSGIPPQSAIEHLNYNTQQHGYVVAQQEPEQHQDDTSKPSAHQNGKTSDQRP